MRILHVTPYSPRPGVRRSPASCSASARGLQRAASTSVVTTTATGSGSLPAVAPVLVKAVEGVPVTMRSVPFPQRVLRRPRPRSIPWPGARAADVCHIHGVMERAEWWRLILRAPPPVPYVISPRAMCSPRRCGAAGRAKASWRGAARTPATERRRAPPCDVGAGSRRASARSISARDQSRGAERRDLTARKTCPADSGHARIPADAFVVLCLGACTPQAAGSDRRRVCAACPRIRSSTRAGRPREHGLVEVSCGGCPRSPAGARRRPIHGDDKWALVKTPTLMVGSVPIPRASVCRCRSAGVRWPDHRHPHVSVEASLNTTSAACWVEQPFRGASPAGDRTLAGESGRDAPAWASARRPFARDSLFMDTSRRGLARLYADLT